MSDDHNKPENPDQPQNARGIRSTYAPKDGAAKASGGLAQRAMSEGGGQQQPPNPQSQPEPQPKPQPESQPQSQPTSQKPAAAPLAAKPLDKGPTAPPNSKKKKGGGFMSTKFGLFLKIFAGLSFVGLIAALIVGIWAFTYVKGLEKDLPDYAVLEGYEPQVTTRVHAGDGSLVAEFATERRLFVPIEDFPDSVIYAIISAEDKTFYEHNGIDIKGIIRAARNNALKKITGQKAPLEGASTITQQVAKNFLLNSEQKYERKVREILISRRIEKAFTKDEILELYLNEIYLGNRSYGMAAAALNYFDKSLKELTIGEAAYLATLPKAPNNYHPINKRDQAIARRDWIVGRMLNDGHITEEQADLAKAEEFNAKIAPPLGARKADAEYFAEEVRKEIAERYGFEALYEGGLSVRTTLDPRLQAAAEKAFRKWLVEYDQRHGWRGAVDKMVLPLDLTATIEQKRETDKPVFEWQSTLRSRIEELDKVNKFAEDLAPWKIGVILSATTKSAKVGFTDGSTGQIPLASVLWAREYGDEDHRGPAISNLQKVLSEGDIVYAELIPADGIEIATEPADDPKDVFPRLEQVSGTDYALRQVPAVNGGFIAIDPHTGRVLAMVGGYSFGLSEFNRATQARRQPGSTFKPFVYAAALDNGYTPSSIVLDAPFVAPSLGDDWWKPGNYIAGRFYGESTLRLGIEKSRNTMTARLAQDIGIGLIIRYAERFGVSDKLPRELAISLGAGETTLIDLTTAYSMFVNGGRKIQPVLIDRVQDRYGRTVYRRDARPCPECEVEEWKGQSEPQVPDNRQQVIDPRTAYQMVSILEGVIQRGTGAKIRKVVGNPVAGKTGTTDDYRDAWFVGFSPDLAAGVYVGFDLPASMGQGEGGGIVAAPVFGEFMAAAIGDQPAVPFRAPGGIRLVRVNAKTGKPAKPGEANVILEAFKAEDDIYSANRTDDGTTDEGIDDDLGGLF